MPRFASIRLSSKLFILTILTAGTFAGGLGLRLIPFSKPQRTASTPAKERIIIQKTASSKSRLNLREATTINDDAAMREELRLTPLALASADFDEDGIPDLVSSYANNNAGQIRLYRGAPNSSSATSETAKTNSNSIPFQSTPKLWMMPERPDFIAAGDFNADGHADLVIASRQANVLYFLSGDGKGDFTNTQTFKLDGTATAMIAGDINRHDGEDALIIGVETPNGAEAMIYEHSVFTASTNPQIIPVSHSITALGLGNFRKDGFANILIAAGSDLYIGENNSTKITFAHQSLAFAIQSIATGHFTDPGTEEAALLTPEGAVYLLSAPGNQSRQTSRANSIQWPSRLFIDSIAGESARNSSNESRHLMTANLSRNGSSDLIVVDTTTNQLKLITKTEAPEVMAAGFASSNAILAALPMRLNSRPGLALIRAGLVAPLTIVPEVARTFTVNTTADADDMNPGDGVCSAASSGPPLCTLRAAIQEANANPGSDIIIFNIGSGPQTISIGNAFPTITESITIDGTPQNGAPANQTIAIDGSKMTYCMAAGPGFAITSGGSRIRALTIGGFICNAAISLSTGGNNIIEGNTIAGNETGVVIDNSPNNTIGGTASGTSNTIYGNGTAGIIVQNPNSTGNLIAGNLIGVRPAGISLTQDYGVYILLASGNTIGGNTAAARNVISGNNSFGIYVSNSAFGDVAIVGKADNNLIQGNYIGVDANGTSALGNTVDGIYLLGTNNTTIGGAVAGAGNIIANNGSSSFSSSGNGINLVDFPQTGINNTFSANSIYNNSGLGINLGPQGVTPNDAGDADTGANNLQNFPVITSALTRSTGTIITGTLNSTPSRAPFIIELFSNTACDPSGNGEGEIYLGQTSVSTDANGNASFTFSTSTVIPAGRSITATATDSSGNTSEFSACFAVQNAVSDLVVTQTATPNPVYVGNNLTYNITVSNNGPNDASGIRLTETIAIPSGQYTVVSATTTAPGGSCSGTGPITCNLGSLTVKGTTTATIVISPTIPNFGVIPPQSVNATGTVTVTGIEQDSNLTNNLSAVNTTVNSSADLSTTITANPATVASGSVVTYTVTLQNNGPSNAAFALVTVRLPGQLTNITCSPTGGAICSGSGILWSASIGNLGAGSSVTAILRGTLSCLNNNQTLASSATVTGQTFDPNSANNAASINITGQAGTAVGTVTYDAGGSGISLGPVVVGSGNAASGTFTLENTGCLPMNISSAQFLRADTPSLTLATKDDTRYFTLRVINADNSETTLNPSGTDRDASRPIPFVQTLNPGQRLRFRVVFNPPLPYFAGFFSRSDLGLNANQVLPDSITSQVIFNYVTGSNPSPGLDATGDPGTTTPALLLARVSPAIQIIPRDGLIPAPGAPLVVLERTREDFRIRVSLYDANRNVTKIVYQFFDTYNQPADSPITVDLSSVNSQVQAGQCYTIQQDFLGGSARPDVTKVRVTVTDGDGTSVNASSSSIPGFAAPNIFTGSSLTAKDQVIEFPSITFGRNQNTIQREKQSK